MATAMMSRLAHRRLVPVTLVRRTGRRARITKATPAMSRRPGDEQIEIERRPAEERAAEEIEDRRIEQHDAGDEEADQPVAAGAVAAQHAQALARTRRRRRCASDAPAETQSTTSPMAKGLVT